jgi:hypothetical protein
MSGQVDPWDAMVQSDGSDEDYIPTGADGMDDEDQDLEEQVDDLLDIDDDDLRDTILGLCMRGFTWVTSHESRTYCFAQTSNLEVMKSQVLELRLCYGNSPQTGWAQEW